MKRLYTILMLGLLCLFLPSCATILSRSKYDISINSEPSNAYVQICDRRGAVVARGVTPFTTRLKAGDGFFKRASYSLQFSKEGYEDVQYALTASLDPQYFWNLISWSAWGMLLVDPATGAMWKFDGDAYTVPLTPKRGYYVERERSNSNNNSNVNTNNNNINIIIKKSDLE